MKRDYFLVCFPFCLVLSLYRFYGSHLKPVLKASCSEVGLLDTNWSWGAILISGLIGIRWARSWTCRSEWGLAEGGHWGLDLAGCVLVRAPPFSSASWLPQVEQISSSRPFHHALSATVPASDGLNLLEEGLEFPLVARPTSQIMRTCHRHWDMWSSTLLPVLDTPIFSIGKLSLSCLPMSFQLSIFPLKVIFNPWPIPPSPCSPYIWSIMKFFQLYLQNISQCHLNPSLPTCSPPSPHFLPQLLG